MYQQLGSTICNTDLFKPTTTFNAIRDHGVGQCQRSKIAMNELTIISNPKCLYCTHEIASWIQWLLRLESIEVAIENWKEELKRATSTSDVQQSPAWKYFTWADANPNDQAPLQLAFSLFIDWFNPCGNKLAGKQESLGCIALTCLNLPPAIRNKPAYSLLYAIVPGPSAPDVVTISNVRKPLVDELMVLKDGIQVKTYQHPQGQMVYAQPLPLVGDLMAVHKVVGFGSHLAKQFCGWCMANSKYLQSMKVGERCSGVEILTAACAWKDSKTIKSQEEIQMKTGTCWSELNRLPYRAVNMHVALGVLHNWLEGVLAVHFWEQWGFQEASQENKRAIIGAKSRGKRMRLLESSGGVSDRIGLDGSDSGEEEEDEDDLNLGGGVAGGFMKKENMVMFCELMGDVIMQTGATKLPQNLGEARHGRLKAAQWLSLITLVVPLIIPKMYIESKAQIHIGTTHGKFLQNTGDLIQCTRIICARTIRDGHAGRFYNAYNRYTKLSRELFNNPKIRPNHHYALHIPEQIKTWGPLMEVAEFTGERLIGILQKVGTNCKIGKLDECIFGNLILIGNFVL
ncbi:hypothetical protein O181_066251 [Austropuccinia psidii MF-1]|uniref:Uncharacterized protein n=1 Tax=Austropuccinia psidii MF-1 TaxID=1389203 RepID=A0A9Q3EX95_9BASI|nr:hypothetical protein [Austropuccinia psidii MF-1]